MKKYLLHPRYVVSKSDGDRHYITSQMLMELYNVSPKECVTFLPYRPYPNRHRLIDLYPMASGKYKDMQKQEDK